MVASAVRPSPQNTHALYAGPAGNCTVARGPVNAAPSPADTVKVRVTVALPVVGIGAGVGTGGGGGTDGKKSDVGIDHGSAPCCGSAAARRSRPLTTAAACGVGPGSGSPPRGPGVKSRICFVPAAVPSVTHNSRPCAPSSAENSARFPTTAYSPGPGALASAEPCPGTGTGFVPAGVPSLTHNCGPWAAS